MKKSVQKARKTLIEHGYDADYLPSNMNFSFLYDCKKGLHKLTKAFLTIFPDWLNIDDPKNGNLLNSAVESGKLAFVKYLVKKGAPMNLRDESGDTPLQTAINWKRRKIAKYLLESGANPNNTANNGYTTLTKAIKAQWTEVVDLMLQNKVDITPNDLLFVILDAKKNATKYLALEKLLKYGANPNTVSKYDGDPMLFIATMHDLDKIVEVLLDAGADINIKNPSGWTSWMYAKYYKSEKVLKVLEKHGAETIDLSPFEFIKAAETGDLDSIKSWLAKGVDLELKTSSGVTAFYRSISRTQYEVANYLLDVGANPNIVYDETNSPLVFVATDDSTDTPTKVKMTKRLLAAGAKPNEGEHGSRAFYFAVLNEEYEVAELLYQAGADINSVNKFHEGLLIKSIAKNNTKMFDYLVKRGIHINGSRDLGKDCKITPIGYAANQDNLAMVQRLVNLGVNSDIKNYLGHTALMCCADLEKGDNRAAIAQALIKGGANLWIRQNSNVPALSLASWKKDSPVVEVIQLAATWDKVDYKKLVANMTMQQFNKWLIYGPSVVVKYIISAGFDINNLQEGDESPLFIASQYGMEDMLYYLFDIGADPTLHPLAMEVFDEKTLVSLKTLQDLQANGQKLTEHLNFYPKGRSATDFLYPNTPNDMEMTWDCIDYTTLIADMRTEDFNVWIEIAPYRVVENILKAGYELKTIEKYQIAPLMVAIQRDRKRGFTDRHPFYTQLLLDYNADPSMQGSNGNNLGTAAYIGTDIMQALINAGADVNQWVNGSTPLNSAIYTQSYDGVKFLLDNGANPNLTKAGFNALYRAVQAKNIKIVQLLLEYGADPNCKCSIEAKTPLDEANKKGLKEIAKLLAKYTSIDIRDIKGRTPLFKACIKGDIPQIKNLLAKSASIKIVDNEGNSLESFARLRPEVADLIGVPYQRLSPQRLVKQLSPAMQHLLRYHVLPTDADIDINDKDYYGNTLLHYAVLYDNIETIEQLLSLGADPYAKNKRGETPILRTVALGFDSIKTLFENKGIQPVNKKRLQAANNQAAMYGRIEDFEDAINNGDLQTVNEMLDTYQVNINQLRQTNTPLMLAIYRRDNDMVRLLLQKGADIEVSTNTDLPPLLFAVNQPNNGAIIRTLLEHGADPLRSHLLFLNALLADNFDVLELLITKGARLHYLNDPIIVSQKQFDQIFELAKIHRHFFDEEAIVMLRVEN